MLGRLGGLWGGAGGCGLFFGVWGFGVGVVGRQVVGRSCLNSILLEVCSPQGRMKAYMLDGI